MDKIVTESAIAAYIRAVDKAGVLGKSQRRVKLLQYILQEELRGEGENLKAYSIGIDVLDRPEDFDPVTDSSVRVEMGRLRTALAAFENSPDATGEISVEIPVGSYRPTITARPGFGHTLEPAANATSTKRRWFPAAVGLVAVAGLSLFLVSWVIRSDPEPTVAEAPAPVVPKTDHAVFVSVVPFAGTAPEKAQVETALRHSLVRNQSIATRPQGGPFAGPADFSLSGLVSQMNDARSRIDVELTNHSANQVVWAKSLVVNPEDDITERVGREIGNELRVRLLGASKAFLEGRDPERLTPQQLFVMATWVPGPATNAVEWEKERIALMEMALAKKPDFGNAHSVLADKLSYLANVYGPSATEELSAQAQMHAERALELAPLNPDVMFNVAQSHWHAGRINQSHAVMRRVIDLDPGHDLARFLSMVIPYTCSPPPPEIVAQATAFDDALSPDNPIRWLTLSWIAWLHLNSGDFEKALEYEEQAALIFEIPYTFMRHAMLLNKLGRPEDAAEIIRRQQVNWPAISPEHFARVTVPRLCGEHPQERRFIEHYEELAAAMAERL